MMNIDNVARNAQSYSKFRDYLSEQAETLDETLADAKPGTADVYVKSSSFNDAEELGDVVHTTSTFSRMGDSLSLSVKKENMVGYDLGERSISFDRMKNGKTHVTDFDGQNLNQVVLDS